MGFLNFGRKNKIETFNEIESDLQKKDDILEGKLGEEAIEKEKQAVAQSNKEVFRGLELSQLTLENMREMNRIHEEMKNLTPEKLDFLKKYIKNLTKDSGLYNKALMRINNIVSAALVGTSSIGLMETTGTGNTIMATTAIVTGGSMLIAGITAKFKRIRERNKQKKEFFQAYIYAKSKYGDQIADNIIFSRIDGHSLDKSMSVIHDIESTGVSRDEAKKIYEDIISKFEG